MKQKTRKNKNKNKNKNKKSRKDGWHPNLLISSIQDLTYFIRDLLH